MATNAAMPRMIEEIKSNKRDLLRRLSRQAIKNVQRMFRPLRFLTLIIVSVTVSGYWLLLFRFDSCLYSSYWLLLFDSCLFSGYWLLLIRFDSCLNSGNFVLISFLIVASTVDSYLYFDCFCRLYSVIIPPLIP